MSLSVQQADDIAKRIVKRRELIPLEDLHTAVMVVLMNYGSHLTKVRCTNGEWLGVKADLPMGEGIPKCPNGHVLVEGRKIHHLTVVEDLDEEERIEAEHEAEIESWRQYWDSLSPEEQARERQMMDDQRRPGQRLLG